MDVDATPNPNCPGCRALPKLIAELKRLEARIAELEARLKENSSNSHKPPSSDPPWKPKPAQPKPTGRKPGGQPGHPGTTRGLLPPEDLDEIIDRKPTNCGRCGKLLDGSDAHPRRRQVVDLPTIRPWVTEYHLHGIACDCGAVTYGEVPKGVPDGVFGRQVRSIGALLTGAHRLSRRAAEQIMSDIFNLDISLGSLSNLEGEMTEALATPYEEAAVAARGAAQRYVDETGWAKANDPAWLWVVASVAATVFVVRGTRGAESARALLGDQLQGTIVTDRWSGYNWLPLARRQLCWAHLIRDFRKLSECGEPVASIGERLLEDARKLFAWWHRVRDGTLRRSSFGTYVVRLRARVRMMLEGIAACSHRRAASLCRGILRLEPAMWTFVRTPGVEPTNNAAERALRPAVLWRKGSYGSRSEAGHAFVERMLTIVTTLRQHGRNVLDYLSAACSAALSGEPAPALLPCLVSSPEQTRRAG